MLWRLKSFWEPFWRFLVWGDSTWGKVTKVIGLLLFIGGPSIASFWESPGYLILHAFNREIISTPFRFSILMAIILAVLWTLICIGRAYELAGIPDLQIAEELVDDRDVFRLILLCNQKDFETTVSVMEVFNVDGTRRLPGRFPLELDWTHHSGESRVHLVKGVPTSVSVAQINRSSSGLVGMLFCTGAKHGCPIEMQKGQSVYFHLRIEHAKQEPIERWFRFERTDEAEFKAFPNLLPPFTPQANLLMSRRVA